MKKNISYEEKLNFVEKYNDEKFQEYYKNLDKVLFPIGFVSLKAFTIISILGGLLISPWLFLGFIPAFITPAITTCLTEIKRKKAIESLTKNITYKDFKEMIKTDEFTKLQYEKSAKEMKLHHYAKENNSKIIVPKNEMENSSKKSLIFEEKPIKLSFNILSKFAESIDCSLVEFSPSNNPDEPHAYHVKLVTGKNKFMEFCVTHSHFIGLYTYDELDLTAEWRIYLRNENKKSKNVDKNELTAEEIATLF